jgi:hypothetical protein
MHSAVYTAIARHADNMHADVVAMSDFTVTDNNVRCVVAYRYTTVTMDVHALSIDLPDNTPTYHTHYSDRCIIDVVDTIPVANMPAVFTTFASLVA